MCVYVYIYIYVCVRYQQVVEVVAISDKVQLKK